MTIKMKLAGCLVVVALLLAFLVTGAAAQEGSILDDILKNGVVRVGISLTWPGIAFRDDKGNPKGFEPDIAKFLAEKLGVKLEIVDLPTPARVSALAARKIDIVIAGFTRTLERSKSVAFCEVPYLDDGNRYLVRIDSPYKTLEDLQAAGNKVKVGVDRGGTSEQWVSKLLPNAQVVKFDSVPDATLALTKGVIDVGSQGTIGSDFYMKENPGILRGIPGTFASSQIVAAVPYGDFKWWHWCNLFFWELNAWGDNVRMYKKWVGTEPEQLAPWIEIR